MDAGFATVNQQQQTAAIPTEIYQPLLSIALRGYTTSDVTVWYQSMLRHLNQSGTDSLPVSSGFDLVTDAAMDMPYPGFLDTECAARRATMATIDSCISASTKMNAIPSTEIPTMDQTQVGQAYPVAADSTPQAYNTPQSYQTYATTPQQLDSTPEPPQSQQLAPTWSPAPSSIPEPDLYTLQTSASMTNGNPVAFTGEPTNSTAPYPWFSAQDVGSSLHSRNHSQQSQLSHHSLPSATTQQSMGQQLPFQQQLQQQPQQPYLSAEYNTQMPGAAMPVLIPYASSSGSSNYTKAAAIPTGPGGASLYSSSTGSYFPIIHVSSSRRRRKALQKGVKKMIVEPLKGRRQQSV